MAEVNTTSTPAKETKVRKPKMTEAERLAKLQAARQAAKAADLEAKAQFMELFLDGFNRHHNQMTRDQRERILLQAARVQIFLGLGRKVTVTKVIDGEPKQVAKALSWTAWGREDREDRDRLIAALRRGELLRFDIEGADGEDDVTIDFAA